MLQYVFRKGETDIIKGIIKSNPTRYALSGISGTKSKGKYGSDHLEKLDYLVTSREVRDESLVGSMSFCIVQFAYLQVLSVSLGWYSGTQFNSSE